MVLNNNLSYICPLQLCCSISSIHSLEKGTDIATDTMKQKDEEHDEEESEDDDCDSRYFWK